MTGYNAVTRAVRPLNENWTENMGLSANTATCNAPGYQFSSPVSAYSEMFEANNGGYVISTTTMTSWAWACLLQCLARAVRTLASASGPPN